MSDARKLSQWISQTAFPTELSDWGRNWDLFYLNCSQSVESTDFRCVPSQVESPFSPKMDSGSQNDSDGGGEHLGESLTGLASVERDEGSTQPRPLQTIDAPSAPGVNSRLRPHTPPVLSLDQIRISGSSNEYTDGPSAAQRSPDNWQLKNDVATSTGSRTNGQLEAEVERSNNLWNLRSATPVSSREDHSRSSSLEGSQNSIRIGTGSSSSGQRLHVNLANGNEIIRNQPKPADSEELKPLNAEYRNIVALPGSRSTLKKDKHSNKCESCGRCQCAECVRPRELPSCWMCSQRCVCSPKEAVEYGTCVCCIKGFFYHCSNNDEDTSSDKPFSCSQERCCMRWTTISVFSLFFPCLLCYLPATGCLAMCQCCYDRVSRPGCRCKNSTLMRHHTNSTTA